MGDDIEYMRTEWITFLHVHLAAIQGFCNIDYVVGDSWGVTNVDFSIADMQALRTVQGQAYPTSQPQEYVSPYSEKCPEYGYTPGAPHETPCTFENYPGGTSLPQVSWTEFRFREENVYEDDPVKRFTLNFAPDTTTETPYDFVFSQWKSNIPDIDDCFFCNIGNPSMQVVLSNPEQGGKNYVVPGWVTDFS